MRLASSTETPGARLHRLLGRLSPEQRRTAEERISAFREGRHKAKRLRRTYRDRNRQPKKTFHFAPGGIRARKLPRLVAHWGPGGHWYLLHHVEVRKDHPALFCADRDLPRVLAHLFPMGLPSYHQDDTAFIVPTGYALRAPSMSSRPGRNRYVRYVYGVFPRKKTAEGPAPPQH